MITNREDSEHEEAHSETTANLSAPEGKLMAQPELNLDALVADITDANRHGETDTAAEVGKEV